jgi:hypothetical protein
VFFSRVELKIDKSLYRRLQESAARNGYATTEEMIMDVLERAADRGVEFQDDLDAERQLRGLGYVA